MTDRGDGGGELLSTKLAPPRLRAPLVTRRGLTERLDAGLDRRLTLVCAPAGSGKTTLVAGWLAERGAAGGPAHAWVSLEPEDDDPARFWRYVLAAAEGFGASVGGAAARLLRAQQPPWEAVLTAFLNALAALPGRCVLVLEDYHALASERIHEQVAFLVDHLPPTLHLVLVTRAEPALPLARLRARGEVAELGPDDLRFSAEETRSFLAQVAPSLAGGGDAARLARSTGGWAAGLRLAALAIQGKPDREARRSLEAFGGGHRHVRDYLASEVLATQPEPVREFLLRTAFLGRLTPALCDAVTGGSGAAALLEEVERARLFVVALGDEGGRTWYRFHALFADAVRECALQRFGDEGVRALHERASRWHEEHGMLGEAVEAALTARAFPRAAGLMERVARPELMQNTYATLRRWLDALPVEVIERRPRLCFLHAVALLFTSDRRDPAALAPVEVPLRRAEAAWESGENGGQPWGELSVLRSMVAFWRGDLPRMAAAARAGLEQLPPEESQWRGIALVFVAYLEVRAGRLGEARRLAEESRARCEAAGNVYGSCSALLMLGDVCAMRGEAGEAAAFYEQVLARLAETPLNPKQSAYTGGRARLGLAALSWDRNDAVSAARQAEEAYAIARVAGDDELWAQSSLLLARMAFARGEAGDALRELHAIAAEPLRPEVAREMEGWRARIALSEGDAAAARRWYALHGEAGAELPAPQRERESLLAARLLLAEGEAARAVDLLAPLRAEARENGRARGEIEILLVTALAESARSRPAAAAQALAAALAAAHPAGAIRPFLDEGRPLVALLRSALPSLRREPLAVFARAVLEAAHADPRAAGGDSPLAHAGEPLSGKEQQVLRLVGEGLSNPEIARELIVSVNTIKTHLKRIYQKLGVSTRRQAREAARRLALR